MKMIVFELVFYVVNYGIYYCGNIIVMLWQIGYVFVLIDYGFYLYMKKIEMV